MPGLRFGILLAILSLITVIFVSDCALFDPLRDMLTPKTERERYAREWRREVGEDDHSFKAWLQENDRALRNATKIKAPLIEIIAEVEDTNLPNGQAQGRSIMLPAGRKLVVEVEQLGNQSIYGELYLQFEEYGKMVFELVDDWTYPDYKLKYVADENTELVLLLQTRPGEGGKY